MCSGMTVAFEQAAIKIEREKEFDELRGALNRVFAPQAIEKFLKRLDKKGQHIRNCEAVLASGALEASDEVLAKSGTNARALYDALPVSDQAQLREFYLSKLEGVDAALRHKFKKLYTYY